MVNLWPRAISSANRSSIWWRRQQAYFANRHDVYVSGNLLIYYEEGNLKRVVSPDVFVVFGIPPGDRRVYQIGAKGALCGNRNYLTCHTTP